MANDNPVILSKLQKKGFGLFVNSRKHLQLGLNCGFDPEKITFASTGIPHTLLPVRYKPIRARSGSLPCVRSDIGFPFFF